MICILNDVNWVLLTYPFPQQGLARAQKLLICMSLKDVVVVLLTHPLQRSSNDMAAVQVGVFKPIDGIELAIAVNSDC